MWGRKIHRVVHHSRTLVPTDVDGKEMEMIAVLFNEFQHNNEKTLHSGHDLGR